MSALVVIGKAASVEVLTDAAATDASGRIVSISPKQLPLRLSGGDVVLLANIGWSVPMQQFAARVRSLPSFGDVLRASDEMWRSMPHVDPRVIAYSVIVAGLHPTRRAIEAYHLSNEHDGIDGPLSALADGGGIKDSLAAISQPFVDQFGSDPEVFDARRDAPPLFNLYRRCIREYDGGSYPCVGGFVQHSTLSRAGLQTRVLHSWPDRIGCQIAREAA